jgi:sulfite reductase (ferredoxin)
MKFLIKDRRDEFMRLVDEEKAALSYQIINWHHWLWCCYSRDFIRSAKVTIEDTAAFETWKNQMS